MYPMLFVFIGKIAGYEKKRDQENALELETAKTKNNETKINYIYSSFFSDFKSYRL